MCAPGSASTASSGVQIGGEERVLLGPVGQAEQDPERYQGWPDKGPARLRQLAEGREVVPALDGAKSDDSGGKFFLPMI